jgi:hypothetical protein
MPTEPFTSVAVRPSFLFKKIKQKQPPPAAFDNTGSRRQHGRSSSLGSFVARILPARREERGYTLRASFQDDGTQNAADLVFGVPKTPAQKYHSDSTVSDRGVARRPPSRSHNKDEAITPRPDTEGMDGEGVSMGNARDSRRDSTGRRSNAPGGGCRRLFSLRKSNEAGRPPDYHTVPRLSKQEMQTPVVVAQKDPLLDVAAGVSKVQRMYLDKKARRAKRRSIRDSGDFLGVQGANPRTGYWDPSTGTSSSDPSQMSEETRKRIDLEAKDIEEKKRKWEEAQAKLQTELERVQTLKNQRRSGKAEQKKINVRARQRMHGHWGLNDNGWSSVAEPELSSIIQSVAGTPMRGKLSLVYDS